MSVIFGICVSQQSIVDESSLLLMAKATERFGADETEVRVHHGIGMGYQAFHTHDRSRLERQPARDCFGNMLVLDGRLDNHRELAVEMDVQDQDVPDSVLVLKAFARWGDECFAHLVGDWSLVLWSANDRVLYLSRDHAGTRTLFYSNQEGEVIWSTSLESFFVAGGIPDVDSVYIARLLSSQEIRNLTPYQGIHAVPPAHYIAIHAGRVTSRAHWRWVADKTIVYKTEAEYDEHFLFLFRQAVERRIGPGAPILAQLSGGVDSSAIVCMADRIRNDSSDESELLETVSYFDDTEPDWDERPYFTRIE
jgi:asparagine synthase (glutamine-hydrolysing)